MNLNSLLFAAPGPYPTVKAECENPRYAAAMLANIAACSSEMSAVCLYFYNSTIIRDSYKEFSQCFHKVSIVEMHHLEMFSRLAYLLGTDPRMWCMDDKQMKYWSPGYNQYPAGITALVKNALAGEKETIKKYKEQCGWIEDKYIIAVLKRIIQDEEVHARIFEAMLEEL